jgi:glutamate racemase
MITSNSIGIFDSGIGGLSIYKELKQLMPNESFIYVADSNNAPYGEKSDDEIRRLSFINTQFLVDHEVKLIVVACNTATTAAIKSLRKSFNTPFVGIEPAIKPAVEQSTRKKIGILATKGTLNSSLFHETYQRFGKDIELTTQVGSGLVQLIENGKIYSNEMTELLKRYLQPMIDSEVDHLVLGCTHYPFLKDQIQALTPKEIELVDSGKAVAKQTERLLSQHNITNTTTSTKSDTFFVNGMDSVLREFIQEWQLSPFEINPL